MKLSPFMKEHKENLNQIELIAQQEIKKDKLTQQITIKDNVIKSKNFRIEDQQRIIVKYKELLETAVEHI